MLNEETLEKYDLSGGPATALRRFFAISPLSEDEINNKIYSILELTDTLLSLRGYSADELTELTALTFGESTMVLAALNLGIFASRQTLKNSPSLRSPYEIYNNLGAYLEGLAQEHFLVLGLNAQLQVVDSTIVYKGTVNSAQIRVAEVLKRPIILNCPNILLVHNHPSGKLNPSVGDIKVTDAIIEAAQAFDIRVIDHLIVGNNNYYSLRERGDCEF